MIQRECGVVVDGYIVGGDVAKKELDSFVAKAAALLTEHYGKDVVIRFNSDGYSGGAYLRDKRESVFASDSSIGIAVGLVNRQLYHMSKEELYGLSDRELRELLYVRDRIVFYTYISLENSVNTVDKDSLYVTGSADLFGKYEYRSFDSLDEAAAYLFAHAQALKPGKEAVI